MASITGEPLTGVREAEPGTVVAGKISSASSRSDYQRLRRNLSLKRAARLAAFCLIYLISPGSRAHRLTPRRPTRFVYCALVLRRSSFRCLSFNDFILCLLVSFLVRVRHLNYYLSKFSRLFIVSRWNFWPSFLLKGLWIDRLRRLAGSSGLWYAR